jgi:hypothetical protein
MKGYDVFSDLEFKFDRDHDQILYDKSIHPHLIKIKCGWCGVDMGNKPCNKGQQDMISHGMCKSCKIKMEKEIKEYKEVK